MDSETLTNEQLGALLAAWLDEKAGPLRRLLGTGRRLELGVQRRMEAVFGRDLSEVRVHDTQLAGQIAERLKADAFTIGPHIFAAPDRLAPTARDGPALLGHELTHVVQQTQPGNVAPVDARPAGYPALPLAWGGSLPAQASPQMQLAAVDDGAEPDALEEQALAGERVVQESLEQEQAGATEIDPHEIADRVYRLMRDDLRLERERRASW